MTHPQFHAFISRFSTLDEATYRAITAKVRHKTLKKRAYLLHEGETCGEFIFILDGCTRIFVTHREKEVDVWFGLPGSVGSDIQSFITGKPSQFFIQVVRELEYLSISKTDYLTLLEQHRVWETFVRKMWEEALDHFVDRTIRYQYLSAEERYHILRSDPQLTNLIPQKYLASYLGITETSLSRIRKNLAGK